MTKKLLFCIVTILALAVCFSACGNNSQPTPPSDNQPSDNQPSDNQQSETPAPTGGVLKLGAIGPFTGSEAYFGYDMLNSYKLAIDEINASGGVLGYTFEIVIEADDGCDANMGSSAAAKIVSTSPNFVVGGFCSGAAVPAAPQFYDAGLIFLDSCANSPNITSLGLEQTFMINSPATHAVVTLGQLCQMLGVSNIGLIHQGDDSSQKLTEMSSTILPNEFNMKVATVQVMEKNAGDISSIVTAVRNSGADVIYLCGNYADQSNAVKQFRRGGYEGIIALSDGGAAPEFITASGSAGEGVYVTAPPFVEFADGGQEYIKKYTDKFGVGPGVYSTLCYDTMYLLKNAIEAAGSVEYDAVLAALKSIEYQGLSGQIKFSEQNELANSNFIVLKVEDGAFKLIDVK